MNQYVHTAWDRLSDPHYKFSYCYERALIRSYLSILVPYLHMYYVPRYILLNMYRTYPLILMLSRVLEKSWSLILMMKGLLLLLCLTRNFWKDWGKFAECIPTSLNKSQEIGFWVAPGCYVGHKDLPSMINVVWHLLKNKSLVS